MTINKTIYVVSDQLNGYYFSQYVVVFRTLKYVKIKTHLHVHFSKVSMRS